VLAQSRPEVAEMSIEELMRIDITSVSRRQQPAFDAPAAVVVITHDDIRRSGMKTIADVLRLAPGLNVAQVNSNKWAVSARGFNGLYANRLLVLMRWAFSFVTRGRGARLITGGAAMSGATPPKA
jgi:iron complex outermembrane receptor protein